MWMFITVFTTDSNMSLSRAISVEDALSYPVPLSHTLILFYNLRLRFQVSPFLQNSPPYTCYVLVFFPFVNVSIFFFSFPYTTISLIYFIITFETTIFLVLYIFTFYGVLSIQKPCLYVTTQHSVINTHINIFSGIQTHNPSISNAKIIPFAHIAASVFTCRF